MAKAIIAFSVKLKVASDSPQASRKYGDAKEFTTKMLTATANKSVSQFLNT